jgi:hypothetical protein
MADWAKSSRSPTGQEVSGLLAVVDGRFFWAGDFQLLGALSNLLRGVSRGFGEGRRETVR